MTAPWNGPPDDHDPIERRLRDLHDHLRERFAPDVHDADKLTAFLTQVDELARAAPSGMRSLPVPPTPPPLGKPTIVGILALFCAVLVAVTLAGLRLLPGSSQVVGSFDTGGLEKPDLKFSLMTTTDLGPFWLAAKRGYFRAAGFTFDPARDVTIATSGADSVARLAARQVDIAYATYAPFFVAQSTGRADLKLVADASSAGPSSCMVVTTATSRVRTMGDMAHARVAVTARNTISDLMIMSTLRENGVDHSTIEWVQVPFPAMAGKLAAGEVDAAFLTEPFLSQAQKTIGAIPLFDTATGRTANMPTAGFGANADFVQRYPKTVAAFQKIMERVTTEATADRTVVEPLLQEFAKVDAETARLATLLRFQSSLDAGRIQRVTDLMLEFGMITERIDAARIIAKPPSTR